MTDKDVINKVARLTGACMHAPRLRDARWRQSYVAQLRGKRAVDLMHRLRPLMGERRREQIGRALASYKENPRASLTLQQAQRIAQRMAARHSVRALATEYGVGKSTIYACARGEHVTQRDGRS